MLNCFVDVASISRAHLLFPEYNLKTVPEKQSASLFIYLKLLQHVLDFQLSSLPLARILLTPPLSLAGELEFLNSALLMKPNANTSTRYTQTHVTADNEHCTLKRQWNIPSTQLSAGLITTKKYCLGQRPVRHPEISQGSRGKFEMMHATKMTYIFPLVNLHFLILWLWHNHSVMHEISFH